MGGWLTVGAVVLAWLLAIAVAATVRLRRARAALDDARTGLSNALRNRHSACLNLVSVLGETDTPTDLTDRVAEARAALDSPGGAAAMEQATAERALDVAVREVSDRITDDPQLAENPAVSAAHNELLRFHELLRHRERAFDTATRELARAAMSWPARWFARYPGDQS